MPAIILDSNQPALVSGRAPYARAGVSRALACIDPRNLELRGAATQPCYVGFTMELGLILGDIAIDAPDEPSDGVEMTFSIPVSGGSGTYTYAWSFWGDDMGGGTEEEPANTSTDPAPVLPHTIPVCIGFVKVVVTDTISGAVHGTPAHSFSVHC